MSTLSNGLRVFRGFETGIRGCVVCQLPASIEEGATALLLSDGFYQPLHRQCEAAFARKLRQHPAWRVHRLREGDPPIAPNGGVWRLKEASE